MRSDNQMTPRSPIAVFAYSILTLGIYQWYWLVKTKGELNRSQAKVAVPTAFVWLIPIVGGVWWYWKYAEAVDEVTHGKYSTPVSFLIVWLLGTIGCAIMQYAFNESHEQPIVTQPTNSTGDGYNNPYTPTIANPVRSQLRQHHVIALATPPIPKLWGRHYNPFIRTRRVQSTHTPKYRLFTTSHPLVHFHHNRHSLPPLRHLVHLHLIHRPALTLQTTRIILSSSCKMVPL